MYVFLHVSVFDGLWRENYLMCEEAYRCLGDPLVYIIWDSSKLCIYVYEYTKVWK